MALYRLSREARSDLRRSVESSSRPSQLVHSQVGKTTGKPENLQGGEATDQVMDNFTANADSTQGSSARSRRR
jgi:hypothetical protein